MQSFFQSAFLQALGYAIANSLWQVALLWIVVVLINSVGKLSSRNKYFVGVVAQFAGFAWFISTLQFYYLQCSESASSAQLSDILSGSGAYIYEPSVDSFSSAVLWLMLKGEQLLPYLSIAYLCMLVFLGVRLGRSFYFTHQISTKGLQKADVRWRLFVRRTAQYLGIKKEIKIYVSGLIKSPLTLGFIKPLILIPAASINNLTPQQLEAVLLHELAHIKRADYLINIIQSIIEIVLFFNPFVQLIGKVIKKERENSCDDWVLQFQYNPAMYAEALLRIACGQAQPALSMNATGTKSDLLSRVKRMLNQKEKTNHYRNHIFSLLLLTIMLSTVAWFQPIAKNNAEQATGATTAKNHKIIVEPLAANINNPLFNPAYFLTKPIQEEINKAVTAGEEKNSNVIPQTEDAGSVIVAKVTPVALQALKDVSWDLNINVDHKKIAAEAIPGVDIHSDINVANLFPDTAKLGAALKNLMLNQLSKADLQKINNDIGNVQFQLASLQNDKYWINLVKSELNNVVKSTAIQIDQLKTENFNLLKSTFENVGQTVKAEEAVKLQESAKKLDAALQIKQKNNVKKQIEQSIKAIFKQQECVDDKNKDAEMVDRQARATRYLKTYSDIAPTVPSVMATPAPLYTPVAYSDELNNVYDYVDNIDDINSAIIVVKRNPQNDSSYVKHITIEITADNGKVKSYEFTVEVYQ